MLILQMTMSYHFNNKRRVRLRKRAALGVILYIDYICIYNFRCTITDIVYFLHPEHHIGCFEFLGYIFFFGKFFYKPRKHFLRLTVDVGKIGVQSATGNYPKYDEISGYVKVPSQQLSDALVEAFKGRLKND